MTLLHLLSFSKSSGHLSIETASEFSFFAKTPMPEIHLPFDVSPCIGAFLPI
jgi:hypothetical protein